MSGVRQKDLLRVELAGIEELLFLPGVAHRNEDLERFIVEGGRENSRFLEG